MPSWNELLDLVDNLADDDKRAHWLTDSMTNALARIGGLRATGGAAPRNVILYASAFLQKPSVPPVVTMITPEDINGLMSVVYGMDCSRGLTLILHTPGGVTTAAESLVAYLRSKFDDVEAIVPALAMSAGTMISLSADRIVMGRQSQLGPIDPQMSTGGGRSVSAGAVVELFQRARTDVLANTDAAHVWAPVVQSMGPSLLLEAENALGYSERMVANWLAAWMFKDRPDPMTEGLQVAKHFNDAITNKSHGRRIDRNEARMQGLAVEDLEDDQELQEAVLTAYHILTIMFEKSPPLAKVVWSDAGRKWLKNWNA